MRNHMCFQGLSWTGGHTWLRSEDAERLELDKQAGSEDAVSWGARGMGKRAGKEKPFTSKDNLGSSTSPTPSGTVFA
jgi:hypothetical protein